MRDGMALFLGTCGGGRLVRRRAVRGIVDDADRSETETGRREKIRALARIQTQVRRRIARDRLFLA